MRKTKAQVSFEFIVIFALVFAALTGFIYIINDRLFEITKEQDKLVMKNLANNVVNEVILASSMNDNYIRLFNIPVKLSGKDYKMYIEENLLVVELYEEDMKVLDHFTALPFEVKGTFIDEINQNTTEHCITKNDFDGIRISRNQASIDTEQEEYSRNTEFDAFISLNCVKDAKSIRTTIRYDPRVLNLSKEETEPVTKSNPDYADKNPLFAHYNLIYDYSTYTNFIIEDEDFARFTYGYLASDCASGSGTVIRLRFKVKENAPEGFTEIAFDDTFEQEARFQTIGEERTGQVSYETNIQLLDCNTNMFTKESLPDSSKPAVIKII